MVHDLLDSLVVVKIFSKKLHSSSVTSGQFRAVIGDGENIKKNLSTNLIKTDTHRIGA